MRLEVKCEGSRLGKYCLKVSLPCLLTIGHHGFVRACYCCCWVILLASIKLVPLILKELGGKSLDLVSEST